MFSTSLLPTTVVTESYLPSNDNGPENLPFELPLLFETKVSGYLHTTCTLNRDDQDCSEMLHNEGRLAASMEETVWGAMDSVEMCFMKFMPDV